MNGQMDEYMDGWMDGWLDGWMDGWISSVLAFLEFSILVAASPLEQLGPHEQGVWSRPEQGRQI